MKIGFIGLGHMAKAIIEGLLKANAVLSQDIYVHSAHEENYRKYAELHHLQYCESNAAIVAQSDLLILAVQPQQKASVVAEITAELKSRSVPLVSLLSGVSIAELVDLIGQQDFPIVRIMPNLNVKIGQGMTAIAANDAAQGQAVAQTEELFRQIGAVITLPEADFSTFVALAGSAPAFVYLFIDALAHAGVKYGLTKKQSVEIVSQMMVGSAQLVQASGDAPWNLIDEVASPGGSTIAGILAMQAAGFETAVAQAVDATIRKDLGE
ncbi:pyrroline-5-carboxylate reductase [Lapidilactobacillus concavus DSM 17758]|uniref:Pyrroline-5-carboxylate reductase n=1 Tax=Lapidilactobacillus concavus DSM 17758 TaxID=1423735 RepID=A0A0R1VT61_9LACO|nr:pyrroline-5-carboxylate reductase [Lapidilactobacillus concavus]KRM08887.1 pyrroline-5-carboxylate reductase [Lapidilactobacillus concavus DSM 17758]GEL13369.1 pyrroline-5-carboxylate reductase [Lapidilactobacillus concavus]